MTTNTNDITPDPYTIEIYSIENADDSDPDPVHTYTAKLPNDIFADATRYVINIEPHTHDDVTFRERDDIDPNPLVSVYEIFVDGHESSYGTLWGIMYVESVS